MDLVTSAPAAMVPTLHLQGSSTCLDTDPGMQAAPAEELQHNPQAAYLNTDQDASRETAQATESKPHSHQSMYPHLARALQSAAEQLTEQRQHPQAAHLLDEFAAEELRTLSTLLPAGHTASSAAADTMGHVRLQDNDVVSPSSESPDMSAAPSPPEHEAHTDAQTQPTWHSQQATGPEYTQEPQPAETSVAPTTNSMCLMPYVCCTFCTTASYRVLGCDCSNRSLCVASGCASIMRLVQWLVIHAERKYQALAADPAAEPDPKNGSSKFRGVYKRRFDTKWRAEITAGDSSLLPAHNSTQCASVVSRPAATCLL